MPEHAALQSVDLIEGHAGEVDWAAGKKTVRQRRVVAVRAGRPFRPADERRQGIGRDAYTGDVRTAPHSWDARHHSPRNDYAGDSAAAKASASPAQADSAPA